MKRFASLSLACVAIMSCASVQPLPSSTINSTAGNSIRANAPEELRVWVDGRAGTGEPVHWVAEGYVYEYPSGKKLFGMVGLESSTVLWPEEPGEPVVHLTRKTFAYTDLESGEILKEFNGKTVEPIAYPYQLIHYRLEDGKIFGDVEQGAGENIQFIEAQNGIPVIKLGDTFVYNASVFLDFPLPSGKQYQAWENYDFFIKPDNEVSDPHKVAWQRYGDLPSWAGEGKAIIQLYSWRVEDHDQIPRRIYNWVAGERPLWLRPPADLEEVRALQRGEGPDRWGD